MIEPLVPCVQQLKEGLNVDGLLSYIKKSPEKFRKFFVIKKNLDEESLLSLLQPSYSMEGSNKYVLEVDIFKYLTSFIENIFYDGKYCFSGPLFSWIKCLFFPIKIFFIQQDQVCLVKKVKF